MSRAEIQKGTASKRARACSYRPIGLPARLVVQRLRNDPGAVCWQVFGLRELAGYAGFLLSTASRAPKGQCIQWRSFSLTAAGQPRILTGFPFQPETGVSGTSTRCNIL